MVIGEHNACLLFRSDVEKPWQISNLSGFWADCIDTWNIELLKEATKRKDAVNVHDAFYNFRNLLKQTRSNVTSLVLYLVRQRLSIPFSCLF